MKLLVATDGSPASEGALAYATVIADATDGSITIVHAVDPNVYQEGGKEAISGLSDPDRRILIESIEDAEKGGADLLEDGVEFAAELGQEVETALFYGDPVTKITDYAEEEEFDSIFVGHRGRSQRTDLVLGSVATDVVQRATIPVTVGR